MSTTPLAGAQLPATVLYQDKATTVPRTVTAGDGLWLTLHDLTKASGWEIKPEGVCREDLCIPLPGDKPSRFIRKEGKESWFNLAEFARLVEQPVAHDSVHNVWSFGQPGWEWKSTLNNLMAPDFTLPDLQGKLHSLSDLRGKKVLLLCWASW